jgi:hypothetical protein
MVQPGYWYVDLDDGGGVDRHTEISGGALEVGALVPHAHGRTWRIDRVDKDSRYAHAVPADDQPVDQAPVLDAAAGMTEIRTSRESVTVTDEQFDEFAGRLRAFGRVDIASELVKRHALAAEHKPSLMQILNDWREEAKDAFPEELRRLRYAIDADLTDAREEA